jgi:hypothetical protein
LFVVLLLGAAALLRVGSAGLLARCFQWIDMFALNHELDDHQVQTKRRTALGGACTLLALTLLALYAAYMVVSWQENNTLVQRSLDALDGGVWQQAAGLPWASTSALPGLTAPMPGIVLRITVDGDPGACAEPLLPPLSSGLASGAWVRAPAAPPDCGGSGVSQLTFICAACVLGPSSSLSLLLHHSCQSLLLEAAAAAPYPADAVALLAADAVAAGGARLSSVSWDVGPLFGVLWDNVTASASRKGYTFTRSVVAPARAVPAPLGVGSYLTVAPLAAAVNVTLLLPLSATYVTTLLTERVPWTQLVANIVGLSGILGVFGSLFGHVEKRLGRAPRGGAGGEKAGAAAPAIDAPEGADFLVGNPMLAPARRSSVRSLLVSPAGAFCEEIAALRALQSAQEERLVAQQKQLDSLLALQEAREEGAARAAQSPRTRSLWNAGDADSEAPWRAQQLPFIAARPSSGYRPSPTSRDAPFSFFGKNVYEGAASRANSPL